VLVGDFGSSVRRVAIVEHWLVLAGDIYADDGAIAGAAIASFDLSDPARPRKLAIAPADGMTTWTRWDLEVTGRRVLWSGDPREPQPLAVFDLDPRGTPRQQSVAFDDAALDALRTDDMGTGEMEIGALAVSGKRVYMLGINADPARVITLAVDDLDNVRLAGVAELPLPGIHTEQPFDLPEPAPWDGNAALAASGPTVYAATGSSARLFGIDFTRPVSPTLGDRPSHRGPRPVGNHRQRPVRPDHR